MTDQPGWRATRRTQVGNDDQRRRARPRRRSTSSTSCSRWFDRVDALFSTWRDDSEISRLGRGEIKRRRTSPEVREVLAACDELTEETRGAFDVTFAADPECRLRPGFAPIDPSGFVKGWAIERAAAMFEQREIANFAINAGGDVLTRGRPEPQRSWEIGIQHPIRGDAIAAIASLHASTTQRSWPSARAPRPPPTPSQPPQDRKSIRSGPTSWSPTRTSTLSTWRRRTTCTVGRAARDRGRQARARREADRAGCR